MDRSAEASMNFEPRLTPERRPPAIDGIEDRTTNTEDQFEPFTLDASMFWIESTSMSSRKRVWREARSEHEDPDFYHGCRPVCTAVYRGSSIPIKAADGCHRCHPTNSIHM